MNFQVSYELRLKRRELPETLAAITPEITFLSQVLWQLRTAWLHGGLLQKGRAFPGEGPSVSVLPKDADSVCSIGR